MGSAALNKAICRNGRGRTTMTRGTQSPPSSYSSWFSHCIELGRHSTATVSATTGCRLGTSGEVRQGEWILVLGWSVGRVDRQTICGPQRGHQWMKAPRCPRLAVIPKRDGGIRCRPVKPLPRFVGGCHSRAPAAKLASPAKLREPIQRCGGSIHGGGGCVSSGQTRNARGRSDSTHVIRVLPGGTPTPEAALSPLMTVARMCRGPFLDE